MFYVPEEEADLGSTFKDEHAGRGQAQAVVTLVLPLETENWTVSFFFF